MNTQDFKIYIKNIRKEALEIGYSIKTMVWIFSDYGINSLNGKMKFILYMMKKNTLNFCLIIIILMLVNLLIKSKSRHQQLMRSKKNTR